jgi:hypothetical protein
MRPKKMRKNKMDGRRKFEKMADLGELFHLKIPQIQGLSILEIGLRKLPY